MPLGKIFFVTLSDFTKLEVFKQRALLHKGRLVAPCNSKSAGGEASCWDQISSLPSLLLPLMLHYSPLRLVEGLCDEQRCVKGKERPKCPEGKHFPRNSWEL